MRYKIHLVDTRHPDESLKPPFEIDSIEAALAAWNAMVKALEGIDKRRGSHRFFAEGAPSILHEPDSALLACMQPPAESPYVPGAGVPKGQMLMRQRFPPNTDAATVLEKRKEEDAMAIRMWIANHPGQPVIGRGVPPVTLLAPKPAPAVLPAEVPAAREPTFEELIAHLPPDLQEDQRRAYAKELAEAAQEAAQALQTNQQPK